MEKKAREGKNGGPEGVWEVSWAIFPKKMSRRRSWPILAGRGNPKMSGRWPKMAPRWGPHEAKMEPRWPKNEPRWPSGEPRWPKRGPKWPSGGLLGSYLGDFSRAWARSLLKSPKYKIEQPYNVFGGFWGLWGPVGSSWRPSWAVLAPSWLILGDLGLGLGFLGRSCLPVSILVTNPNDRFFRGVIHRQAQNGGIASGWTTGRTIEF